MTPTCPPAPIVAPITDALLAELRRAFHTPDAPVGVPLTGAELVLAITAALDELARFRELLGRRYCDEVEQALSLRGSALTTNVIRFPGARA